MDVTVQFLSDINWLHKLGSSLSIWYAAFSRWLADGACLGGWPYFLLNYDAVTRELCLLTSDCETSTSFIAISNECVVNLPFLFPSPLFLFLPLFGVMLFQITVTEAVLFLMQYTSKDLDSRKKTIATGDCCYLNPLVRRTCRFLGMYLIIILAPWFPWNIVHSWVFLSHFISVSLAGVLSRESAGYI